MSKKKDGGKNNRNQFSWWEAKKRGFAFPFILIVVVSYTKRSALSVARTRVTNDPSMILASTSVDTVDGESIHSSADDAERTLIKRVETVDCLVSRGSQERVDRVEHDGY